MGTTGRAASGRAVWGWALCLLIGLVLPTPARGERVMPAPAGVTEDGAEAPAGEPAPPDGGRRGAPLGLGDWPLVLDQPRSHLRPLSFQLSMTRSTVSPGDTTEISFHVTNLAAGPVLVELVGGTPLVEVVDASGLPVAVAAGDLRVVPAVGGSSVSVRMGAEETATLGPRVDVTFRQPGTWWLRATGSFKTTEMEHPGGRLAWSRILSAPIQVLVSEPTP